MADDIWILGIHMSNRRIANALFLSEHTVLGYLKSLSTKLGVHSKLQAVVLGISEGLITLPVPVTAVDVDGQPSENGVATDPAAQE